MVKWFLLLFFSTCWGALSWGHGAMVFLFARSREGNQGRQTQQNHSLWVLEGYRFSLLCLLFSQQSHWGEEIHGLLQRKSTYGNKNQMEDEWIQSHPCPFPIHPCHPSCMLYLSTSTTNVEFMKEKKNISLILLIKNIFVVSIKKTN